jgi:hypothetical protein
MMCPVKLGLEADQGLDNRNCLINNFCALRQFAHGGVLDKLGRRCKKTTRNHVGREPRHGKERQKLKAQRVDAGPWGRTRSRVFRKVG